MRTINVKKLLELGAGHGRDSIFFESNVIQIGSLDYLNAGVD
ncbi:hypothetical protein [Candidatus Nitrosocosmicus sp. R]